MRQEYKTNETFVPAEPTYAENATNTYKMIIELIDEKRAQEIINLVRDRNSEINTPEDFFREAALLLADADNKEQAEEILELLKEKYKKPTPKQVNRFFSTQDRISDPLARMTMKFNDISSLQDEKLITLGQANDLIDLFHLKNSQSAQRQINDPMSRMHFTFKEIDFLQSEKRVSPEQAQDLIDLFQLNEFQSAQRRINDHNSLLYLSFDDLEQLQSEKRVSPGQAKELIDLFQLKNYEYAISKMIPFLTGDFKITNIHNLEKSKAVSSDQAKELTKIYQEKQHEIAKRRIDKKDATLTVNDIQAMLADGDFTDEKANELISLLEK